LQASGKPVSAVKTPITYYGGKQNLVNVILPMIPRHRLYCEPFAGGAAVFFAKPPSESEILNDLNPEIINFYEVLKTDFDALAAEVGASLYSRKLHHNAYVVYANPDMFDRVKRAWAVWYLAATSFGSMLGVGWGSDLFGKRVGAFNNKKAEFNESLSRRLGNTRFENCYACKIIKAYDAEGSFFYTDPPYVGADQGHYAGYTQKHFDALLETLAYVKGKFLLSSYPNGALSEFVQKNGWYQVEARMNNIMASTTSGRFVEKIEVLTANYRIDKTGGCAPALFDENGL
jgi:DNA adenine methylase